MSIDNISRLVAEKNDQGDIPSILHDQIRELEDSLVQFKEKYAHLKDRKNDLERMGVKFEDIKKEINEIVFDIVR